MDQSDDTGVYFLVAIMAATVVMFALGITVAAMFLGGV